MPFSIHFAPGLGIRTRWRNRAVEILRDIAASLETIPAGSGYWSAVKGGIAELNVAEWRFEYIVDPDSERIEVVDARRVRKAAGGGVGRRTG